MIQAPRVHHSADICHSIQNSKKVLPAVHLTFQMSSEVVCLLVCLCNDICDPIGGEWEFFRCVKLSATAPEESTTTAYYRRNTDCSPDQCYVVLCSSFDCNVVVYCDKFLVQSKKIQINSEFKNSTIFTNLRQKGRRKQVVENCGWYLVL